jgi:hypothetical protein
VARPKRWRGSERSVSGMPVRISRRPGEDSRVGPTCAVFGVRRRDHDRRRQLDRRGIRSHDAQCSGVATVCSVPIASVASVASVAFGDTPGAGRVTRGPPGDASYSCYRGDGDTARDTGNGHGAGAAGDVSATTRDGYAVGELIAGVAGWHPTAGVCAAADNAAGSSVPSDTGDAVGRDATEWRHAPVRSDIAAADRTAGTVP